MTPMCSAMDIICTMVSMDRESGLALPKSRVITELMALTKTTKGLKR